MDHVKYLNLLHHNRTQKQLRHFFRNMLKKYYQLPILGTCLSTSVKKDYDNLQKPCCLSACKIWTPFLTSFLRYCKDIANLLLRELWECLIFNNDSITLHETLMLEVLKSTCRKLWCLSASKKSTSSLTSFLRYYKDIANLQFWELWGCLVIPIKIIVSICINLSCLSACKKSTLSFTSFVRYCKGIVNLFWVTWVCLQSFAKYLRLTQVFMWNSALREKLNFCFSRGFC